MELSIQKITENDLGAVIELMRDFAEYENLSQYCEITVERLHAAMFDTEAFVEGLIATDGTKAVAYALFYPNFSSFRGQRGIHLEDIYILEEYRRLNLGEKMLREIAQIAEHRGLARIDFQVLTWNKPAIDFYLKHGADRNDDERHFRFADRAFDRLAS